MITLSIVSHGHGDMVARLTEQCLLLPEVSRVIVTLNIKEHLELPSGDARLLVLHNAAPKGFGANHNAAFASCETPFYCVVNPDIELQQNPFAILIAALKDPSTALAAPLVCSAQGEIEDSWRIFPSPFNLALKVLSRSDGTYADASKSAHFSPDWTAGMFLLFKAEDYAALKGFDEGFFLYYEDVDICARLHRAGRNITGCSDAKVIHHAQRASWHSWTYRRYHLMSILRYFSRDLRRLMPSLLRRAQKA